jgi:hypothetical protein
MGGDVMQYQNKLPKADHSYSQPTQLKQSHDYYRVVSVFPPYATQTQKNQVLTTGKPLAAEKAVKLPENLKTGAENISGISMDDVKVHYNSTKPLQKQALAYAQGPEIHIGPGQEHCLAHEVWHVVQQKQGRVQPTIQMMGDAVNDSPVLEAEADFMSSKVLHGDATIQKDDAGIGKNGSRGSVTGTSVVQKTVHGPETPTNAHNWKIPLPPWIAGTIAHGQIATLLGIQPSAIPRATKILMGIPNPPSLTPYGFADLWQNTGAKVNIAEIKSTATGCTAAQQEAAHYRQRHNEWAIRVPHQDLADLNYLGKVGKRIPGGILDLSGRTGTDLNLGPFWGDPLKNLHIEADNLGAVVYWCTGQGLQISPLWYPVFREILQSLKEWLDNIKKMIDRAVEGAQPVFNAIKGWIQSIVDWGVENSRALAFLLLIVCLIVAIVALIISILAEPVSGGASTVGVFASVAVMAGIVVGLGTLINVNGNQFPEAAVNMAKAVFPDAGNSAAVGADFERNTGNAKLLGSSGDAKGLVTGYNPAGEFLAAAAPFTNPVNLLTSAFSSSKSISPKGIALLNSGVARLETAGDPSTARYIRAIMEKYNWG